MGACLSTMTEKKVYKNDKLFKYFNLLEDLVDSVLRQGELEENAEHSYENERARRAKNSQR